MSNTEMGGEYVAGSHMQDRERAWYRVCKLHGTHMARKVFELCTKFRKIISINLLPNEIIFVFSLL